MSVSAGVWSVFGLFLLLTILSLLSARRVWRRRSEWPLAAAPSTRSAHSILITIALCVAWQAVHVARYMAPDHMPCAVFTCLTGGIILSLCLLLEIRVYSLLFLFECTENLCNMNEHRRQKQQMQQQQQLMQQQAAGSDGGEGEGEEPDRRTAPAVVARHQHPGEVEMGMMNGNRDGYHRSSTPPDVIPDTVSPRHHPSNARLPATSPLLSHAQSSTDTSPPDALKEKEGRDGKWVESMQHESRGDDGNDATHAASAGIGRPPAVRHLSPARMLLTPPHPRSSNHDSPPTSSQGRALDTVTTQTAIPSVPSVSRFAVSSSPQGSPTMSVSAAPGQRIGIGIGTQPEPSSASCISKRNQQTDALVSDTPIDQSHKYASTNPHTPNDPRHAYDSSHPSQHLSFPEVSPVGARATATDQQNGDKGETESPQVAVRFQLDEQSLTTSHSQQQQQQLQQQSQHQPSKEASAGSSVNEHQQRPAPVASSEAQASNRAALKVITSAVTVHSEKGTSHTHSRENDPAHSPNTTSRRTDSSTQPTPTNKTNHNNNNKQQQPTIRRSYIQPGWFVLHREYVKPRFQIKWILAWHALLYASIVLLAVAPSRSISFLYSNSPYHNLLCNVYHVPALQLIWSLVGVHFLFACVGLHRLWKRFPMDGFFVKAEFYALAALAIPAILLHILVPDSIHQQVHVYALWPSSSDVDPNDFVGMNEDGDYLFWSIDHTFPFDMFVQVVLPYLLILCVSELNLRRIAPDNGIVDLLSSEVVSSLDELLSTKHGFASFFTFLKTEFSMQNLLYWKACKNFQSSIQDHTYLLRGTMESQTGGGRVGMETMGIGAEAIGLHATNGRGLVSGFSAATGSSEDNPTGSQLGSAMPSKHGGLNGHGSPRNSVLSLSVGNVGLTVPHHKIGRATVVPLPPANTHAACTAHGTTGVGGVGSAVHGMGMNAASRQVIVGPYREGSGVMELGGSLPTAPRSAPPPGAISPSVASINSQAAGWTGSHNPYIHGTAGLIVNRIPSGSQIGGRISPDGRGATMGYSGDGGAAPVMGMGDAGVLAASAVAEANNPALRAARLQHQAMLHAIEHTRQQAMNLLDKARSIYERFVRDGAPYEVSCVDPTLRQQISSFMSLLSFGFKSPSDQVSDIAQIFTDSQESVYTLMATDAFPRYLRSRFFVKFKNNARARAALQQVRLQKINQERRRQEEEEARAAAAAAAAAAAEARAASAASNLIAPAAKQRTLQPDARSALVSGPRHGVGFDRVVGGENLASNVLAPLTVPRTMATSGNAAANANSGRNMAQQHKYARTSSAHSNQHDDHEYHHHSINGRATPADSPALSRRPSMDHDLDGSPLQHGPRGSFGGFPRFDPLPPSARCDDASTHQLGEMDGMLQLVDDVSRRASPSLPHHRSLLLATDGDDAPADSRSGSLDSARRAHAHARDRDANANANATLPATASSAVDDCFVVRYGVTRPPSNLRIRTDSTLLIQARQESHHATASPVPTVTAHQQQQSQPQSQSRTPWSGGGARPPSVHRVGTTSPECPEPAEPAFLSPAIAVDISVDSMQSREHESDATSNERPSNERQHTLTVPSKHDPMRDSVHVSAISSFSSSSQASTTVGGRPSGSVTTSSFGERPSIGSSNAAHGHASVSISRNASWERLVLPQAFRTLVPHSATNSNLNLTNQDMQKRREFGVAQNRATDK